MTAAKKTTQRHGFKTNEFIVYPAHGVGQIVAIEEQEVAGAKLELFVINFVKDKMTLRVPTPKATMLPELILASYSCARRDHMVRLTRARPFSVSNAFLTSAGSDSCLLYTSPSPRDS